MGINFYYDAEVVRISLDETVSEQDLKDILTVFEKSIRKAGEAF